MNEGIRAIHELAKMGYRARAEGRNIRLIYEGDGAPEEAATATLMALVKQHKLEVLFFLKCFCPRCGGAMTIPDYEGNPLCARCYWDHIVALYPGLAHNH